MDNPNVHHTTNVEPLDAKRHEKPATSLIAEILGNVSSLVRNEVDLARAEINENLKRAGVAIGLLVGAVVIALVALNVLAAALVGAMTAAGLAAGWSALIVGGVLAAIALGFVVKGLHDLKLASLAPTRTAQHLKESAQSIKESF